MALQLWSPMRDLQYLRQDFDDLFDKMLQHRSARDKGASRLALECYVEDQTLIVNADLPGVDPKNVEVALHGDTLTIRGRREQEQEQKTRNVVLREFSYGEFARSISVPRGIDAAKISATFRNGVLRIALPLPEVPGGKVQIQIGRPETGSQAK